MKKTLLIAVLVVLALAAFGVGVAWAQSEQPPYGPGMMRGGYGGMHDYIEQALAAELGLTEEQVEELLASGQSMYQIALDNGIAEDQLNTFMIEVHTAAFDKAVEDGVISREQADWMLQRMQSGFTPGNCPVHGGYNGFSSRYGPGGMLRGRP